MLPPSGRNSKHIVLQGLSTLVSYSPGVSVLCPWTDEFYTTYDCYTLESASMQRLSAIKVQYKME